MSRLKIKLFIVTYSNSIDLNNNLESIFSSDLLDHNINIYIINNHSNFSINVNFNNKVNVLHNVLRPDFSTGHLARNWNQALINGFQNLNNPDCDIVMHCQDDTIFNKNWLSQLLELHKTYSFIQMGIGDNFCSYLPEAVKNVGIWDERLCNIGFQESDYFLRCLIDNRDRSCINDYQHGRLLNNVNFTICQRPQPPNIFSAEHHKSMTYHPINEKVFRTKWPGIPPNYWTDQVYTHTPKRSAIPNFITYPYFEKDIFKLKEKNYII